MILTILSLDGCWSWECDVLIWAHLEKDQRHGADAREPEEEVNDLERPDWTF